MRASPVDVRLHEVPPKEAMIGLTRYTIGITRGGDLRVEADPDGNWVAYADVAVLAAIDAPDPPSRAYRRERERETERRNHDAGLHITPVQTCEQCATPDRADHSATTETSDD